jgi:hypothetical protein
VGHGELFRRLQELRRSIENVLGLSPSMETLLKIIELQEMLRKGVSLRRAVEAVGMGWKNYYKYAPVIYSDPELLIPLPKTFLRDCAVTGLGLGFVEQLRLALNEVAKHAAWVRVREMLARGAIKRSGLGKAWLETAQELAKRWIHEAVESTLEQELRGYRWY